MALNDTKQTFVKKKKTTLFIVLGGIFLTNAIIAEVIGGKIFSLETFLGFPPAQIPFFGKYDLNFDLTAGVLIWPVVFITTDIINEYFGKEGVRKLSFLTAGLISYVFVVLWVATELSPAQFWLDVNNTDSAGNPLNIDEAFSKIFLQGMWIIVGSLVAFLVGQIVDVMTFQWLRKFTGSKKIWLRATGSTLVSQLIDSFVVLFIAFYIGADWAFDKVIAIGIVNYIYKFLAAVILTPSLYIAHDIIDRYLGKELSDEMIEQASESSLF